MKCLHSILLESRHQALSNKMQMANTAGFIQEKERRKIKGKRLLRSEFGHSFLTREMRMN
jgi:hypothetical protein